MEKSKNLFLLLPIVVTMGSQLYAQRPVDNLVPITKTALPSEVLTKEFVNYAIEIILPEDQQFVGFSNAIKNRSESISAAVEIPGLTKIVTTEHLTELRENIDLLITIRFTEYQREMQFVQDYETGDSFHWVGTLYIPVNISWTYRSFPERNFSKEYRYRPNAEGKYAFKTDVYRDLAKAEEHQINTIKALNEEYLTGIEEELRSQCQRFHYLQNSYNLTIYTLVDKKVDFSKTDLVLALVQDGVKLIKPTDVFANLEAAAILNNAIVKYDEIIEELLPLKKKDALFRMYYNKQTLEVLLGNYSAAEESYNRCKKEAGSLLAFSMNSPDDLRYWRYKCDILGLTYQ